MNDRAGEAPPEEREARARVAELERRIHILEAEDEDAFGRFTRFDWWICSVGAVLLPLLLLVWFRP